jgi:hypothetical protein
VVRSTGLTRCVLGLCVQVLTSLHSLGVAVEGGEANDAAQASKQTIMRALEREVRPAWPVTSPLTLLARFGVLRPLQCHAFPTKCPGSLPDIATHYLHVALTLGCACLQVSILASLRHPNLLMFMCACLIDVCQVIRIA